MFDADIHDLETMSRRFSGFSTTVRTGITQRIQPKDKNIAKFVRENPTHSYGVKSDLAKNKCPNIGQIINNDYLKDFLTRRIATKALEEVQRKAAIKHAKRNKGLKFRSGSVISRVPRAVREKEEALLAGEVGIRSKNNSNLASQRSEARASSVMSSTIQPGRMTLDKASNSNPRNSGRHTTMSFHEPRALDYVHRLRMEAFDQRCEDNRGSVKPYLPMLISDEKEVIMEQLEASKNQMMSN